MTFITRRCQVLARRRPEAEAKARYLDGRRRESTIESSLEAAPLPLVCFAWLIGSNKCFSRVRNLLNEKLEWHEQDFGLNCSLIFFYLSKSF